MPLSHNTRESLTMPSLTHCRYAFTPSLGLSFLTLLGITLFISLGVWQLKRADEKRAILTAQAVFLKRAPVAWQPGSSLPKQHERITLEGHFLSSVVLLDNQHHQHQFGYHVLSPLVLNDNQVVMIDRGWVPAGQPRTVLPHIKTPDHTLKLSGTAYYPSEKQWILGEAIEVKQPNLAIIELIDTHLINHFLHKSVYPFIIRLNEDAPHGYKRSWVAVSMPPERHDAYAFQWFAVALTIFILFIGLNINKK